MLKIPTNSTHVEHSHREKHIEGTQKQDMRETQRGRGGEGMFSRMGSSATTCAHIVSCFKCERYSVMNVHFSYCNTCCLCRHQAEASSALGCLRTETRKEQTDDEKIGQVNVDLRLW